jgi:hypothetical protein
MLTTFNGSTVIIMKWVLDSGSWVILNSIVQMFRVQLFRVL